MIPAPPDGAGWRRSSPITTAERRQTVPVDDIAILLHLLGPGAGDLVAPAEYQVGGRLFGIGLGVTAYTLGLRHAFDADHIAAIDNTTRKLMTERQAADECRLLVQPRAQLRGVRHGDPAGHGDPRARRRHRERPGRALQQITGVWGTSVSGVFLVLIGLVNSNT